VRALSFTYPALLYQRIRAKSNCLLLLRVTCSRYTQMVWSLKWKHLALQFAKPGVLKSSEKNSYGAASAAFDFVAASLTASAGVILPLATATIASPMKLRTGFHAAIVGSPRPYCSQP
jgi:hypothetical protein